MTDCCVICKQTRSEVKLFSFPKKKNFFEKWCKNLKLEIDKLSKGDKVCENPTRNLPDDINEPIEWVKSSVRVYRCCSIPNCRTNNSYGIPFFKFPSNPERRELWIRLCNLESKNKSLHICSRHFESDMIVSNTDRPRLTISAIPTIFSSIEPNIINTFVNDTSKYESLKNIDVSRSVDVHAKIAFSNTHLNTTYKFEFDDTPKNSIIPFKIYKRKLECQDELRFEDLEQFEPPCAKQPKFPLDFSPMSHCESCVRLLKTNQLYSNENNMQRMEIKTLKNENKNLKQTIIDLEAKLEQSLLCQQDIMSHINSLGISILSIYKLKTFYLNICIFI